MSGFGLKTLAEGSDPCLDIVAVHGLNGDREKTWSAGNGVLWLRDLLAQDIPDVRIMTFGYNAATHSEKQISTHSLHDHGEGLVGAPAIKRRGNSSRPIIFVAHSLGGLVVKSALIYSDGEKPDHDKQHHLIRRSTVGVVFMGTPHLGSKDATMAKTLLTLASLFIKTSKSMLSHLEQQSSALDLQRKQYSQKSAGIRSMYCYEEYETKIPKTRSSFMVVPKQSAVVHEDKDSESMAIPQDHTGMARFADRDEGGYEGILDCIIRWKQRSAAEILIQPICSTLRFDAMNSRYLGIENLAPYNSGTWLFNSDAYCKWNDSNASILIISGKTGSGKSSVMKMAVEMAKTTFETAKKERSYGMKIPVYFFFDASQDGDTRLRSAAGMYRTLLHQIISSGCPIPAEILSRYKDHKQEDWVVEELQGALTRILSSLGPSNTEVRIFLDAVDDSLDKRDLIRVLKHLSRLLDKEKLPGIRVMVSARDLSEYQNFLPLSRQTLYVDQNNKQDIRTYVEHQLQRLQTLSEAQRNRLTETITRRARGVFLWVRLVIEIVMNNETSHNAEELSQCVRDIPDGMSDVYRRLVARCPESHRQLTLALFQLMVVSQKPLTLQQMRQAFAILTANEPTEAAYRSTLASLSEEPQALLKFRVRLSSTLLGLVEFGSHDLNGGLGDVANPEEDSYLHLIHGTAKTYLVEGGGLAVLEEDLRLDLLPKCHLAVLKLCMKLIEFGDLGSPLGIYAGYFWMKHAQSCDALQSNDGGEVLDLPRDMQQCPRRNRRPVLAELYQEYHKDRLLPNSLLIEGERSLLVLMASAGCSNLALRHAQQCRVCTPKPKDDKAHVPYSDTASRAVFQAAVNENLELVRLFAEHRDLLPVDPDYIFSSAPDPESGFSSFQSSAIYKACYLGQADMVRALLNMGANLGLMTPGGYRTGLHAAAVCGQVSVLDVILDHAKTIDCSRQDWFRQLFTLTTDIRWLVPGRRRCMPPCIIMQKHQ